MLSVHECTSKNAVVMQCNGRLHEHSGLDLSEQHMVESNMLNIIHWLSSPLKGWFLRAMHVSIIYTCVFQYHPSIQFQQSLAI